MKRSNTSIVPVDTITNDTNTSTSSSSILREYLYKYVPIIYHDNVSILSRLLLQLIRKHRYYDFVTKDDKVSITSTTNTTTIINYYN